VGLLILAVVAAGLATGLFLQMWLADRIVPGVYVWDVALGGLEPAEAAESLVTGFEYPADRHPVLRYGNDTWVIDPAQLGTRLDADATVETAMRVGHEGRLLSRVWEQLRVLVGGELVIPTFAFDSGAGAMYLSQIARGVNHPLKNATLEVAEDLTVSVVPGQVGREVDEEATRQALAQRIAAMEGGEVALVVQESKPLLTDLSAVQAQVAAILSDDLTLTIPGSSPQIIERATLAGWLILRPTIDAEGSTTLSVSLDEDRMAGLVRAIADQVDRPPMDAQFRFDAASGELEPVVESVSGQVVDVQATVDLVTAAAFSEQRVVPVAMQSVRPAIATEDAPLLGISELIGSGVTNFEGSTPERVQNIVVGAAQFDGLLIAPGDTFSFNQYLGEVSAEKGYEESIIIWGNTTRADVGGGLCQVSSTAFRAAFWAGLPITERWAHAFRVRYYEPPTGMDATIYSPDVDLKWVNDTGQYILVETYVDEEESTVTFNLYGTNPGRTVEMDGPYEDNPAPHGEDVYRDDPTLPKGETKQIEWAKDGLDVTVYRIIREDGVEVRRDEFFSRYRPWQAVFLVGTKEE
jgi:vancomycin resistance protein YoaR